MLQMGPKKLRTQNLRNRLEECKKYFPDLKYRTLLSLAESYLDHGRFSSCENMLNHLPTKEDLLESLVAKLKGKSVHKTLKQMCEGKNTPPLTCLKGFSSLLTHCVIEMESGHPEYGILLPMLLEKQNELVYSL